MSLIRFYRKLGDVEVIDVAHSWIRAAVRGPEVDDDAAMSHTPGVHRGSHLPI